MRRTLVPSVRRPFYDFLPRIRVCYVFCNAFLQRLTCDRSRDSPDSLLPRPQRPWIDPLFVYHTGPRHSACPPRYETTFLIRPRTGSEITSKRAARS